MSAGRVDDSVSSSLQGRESRRPRRRECEARGGEKKSVVDGRRWMWTGLEPGRLAARVKNSNLDAGLLASAHFRSRERDGL